MKAALLVPPTLLAALLLAGCAFIPNPFSPSPATKVEGDANGVVVKGGNDQIRWEYATEYCAGYNKSAVLLPATDANRNGRTTSFACK
jgi:hypothetical protein